MKAKKDVNQDVIPREDNSIRYIVNTRKGADRSRAKFGDLYEFF
jgi:hypothetical protein